MAERVSEAHPQAWELLDALLAELTRVHLLAEQAAAESSQAIRKAGAAREAEGLLLSAARDLATALSGGAGSSKPPSLGDAVTRARGLLPDA